MTGVDEDEDEDDDDGDGDGERGRCDLEAEGVPRHAGWHQWRGRAVGGGRTGGLPPSRRRLLTAGPGQRGRSLVRARISTGRGRGCTAALRASIVASIAWGRRLRASSAGIVCLLPDIAGADAALTFAGQPVRSVQSVAWPSDQQISYGRPTPFTRVSSCAAALLPCPPSANEP